MRISGTRRARLILFVLTLVVIWGVWRVSRLYATYVQRSIAPTVLAQLRTALQRDIRVDRLALDEPGLLVAEGVHVARGPSFSAGELLSAGRLEVRYDPLLLSWSALLKKAAGYDTRARVKATRIRVPQTAGRGGREFFSASSAETELDFGAALRGQSDQVVASIDHVDVRGVFLQLIRSAEGRWNYEQVLKFPKPKRPTLFRGEFRLASGIVELHDYRAGQLPAPVRNRVSASGTVRYAAFPMIQWDAAGRIEGGQGGPFRAHGTEQTVEKRWFASLDADTRDLPYWYRYTVIRPSGFQIDQGAARASLAAWGKGGDGGQPHLTLNLDVRNGAARLKTLRHPLQSYRGRVTVDGALITLDGRTQVAGVPVTLAGEIRRTEPPQVALRLASKQLTFAALRELFPSIPAPQGFRLPGVVAAQVEVTGENKTWEIRGTGTTRTAQFRDGGVEALSARYELRIRDEALVSLQTRLTAPRGYLRAVPARGIEADIRSRGKVIEVAGRFDTLNGRFNATGWFDTADPEHTPFYATGTLERVDLAQFPWAREDPPPVSGTASGTFVAAGTLEQPRLEASLRGAPLYYGAERVDELDARVRWAAGTLAIPYATIHDQRGTAELSGTVGEDGQLDLEASTEGMELEPLLRDRLETTVKGTAYLRAHVTGTAEAPRVEGRLQVYHPVYGEHTGDYAEATVTAPDLNTLELTGVRIDQAPITAASPRLVLHRPEREQPWSLDGDVTVTGLSVVRGLRLAGVAFEKLQANPVAGEMGPVQLSLHGPLDGLQAEFSASGSSVAALGFDLGDVAVRGSADLATNRLTVASATARSPVGSAELAGTLTFNREKNNPKAETHVAANLDATVRGLRLTPLIGRHLPGLLQKIRVDGAIKTATAHVAGDLEDLRVTGQVELADVLFNERAIEISPFRVAWSPQAAVVTELAAKVGSGRLTAPYLAVLLDPRAKEWPLAQRLAGSLRVELLPISVARQLVEDSPYYRRPEADQVRETLALWRVPVGGDITATLGVEDGRTAPLASVEEAAAVLLARTAAPRVAATLSVPNLVSPPGSEHAPTQLTASATLQGNRLDLQEARLQQEGGALVTLSGYRIRHDGGKASELRISAKATSVPLRSLSRLPIADLRERLAQFQPLDGLLELQAEVTGTDQEPQARFSVDVERPVLNGIPFDQFRLAQGEFDGAKDQLRVAEARITKQVEGEEAATVLLSGSLPLSWPELGISRTATRRLTVEIPEQSLKVFSRLAEDAENYAKENGGAASERVRSLVTVFRQVAATDGRMKGDVTLGGTAVQPRNSGGVSLTGATFRIDGLQTAIKGFNARLELSGDLVRVAEFHGESTQGGEFNGGGSVRLARGINGQPTPNLDLNLAVSGFRVVEKQLGSVLGASFTGSQFSGTLDTVSAATPTQARPLVIRGEWPAPTVEGGVRLDKSSLQLAYEQRGTPEEKTVPMDVRLNVRMFAGDDVWLRNPQLRLKLGGSLLASSTLREPMVTGDLPVTEGSFLLSGLRLRNAEGLIRVAYDRRSQEFGVAPPPPVYVDIAATTSIRVQRIAAEEAEYYDTTFEIRGTPGSGSGDSGIRQASVASGLAVGSDTGLTLTVRTDPPLPSREIEALIRQQFGVEGFSGSGANVVEALRGQIEQAFAVNVTSALASRIEDVLQSALGLSTLSLDLGITQPLRVRLGKRLFGPVYGTVTQEFGNVDSQRQFEVYYRINPQLRVGYRQEDPSGRRVIFFSGTTTF